MTKTRSGQMPFWMTLTLLSAGLVLCALTVARAAEPQPPRLLLTWGKKGVGPGDFDVPIGIAINDKDQVFVSDFKNVRVQQFTDDGKFIAAFAVPSNPSGIASDQAGHLYVARFRADSIALFTEGGRLLSEFGKSGAGDGEFIMPAGLVFGPDKCLYLGDDVNRRVQKFTADGKFVLKWGEPGAGPGQFGGEGTEKLPKNFRTSGPNFLAFNSKRELYVSEARSGRIQKFTSDGKFLGQWGTNAPGPATFGGRSKLAGPTGVCVDRQDRVWVAATNNRIQLFSPEGNLIVGFGVKGSEPGQVNTPHGLALDSHGNLFVVDTRNNRIQKFAAFEN